MNCSYHENVEAKYVCGKCKKLVCEECITDLRGNSICKGCIEQAVFMGGVKRERVGFFRSVYFFILSLLPGAAHMYMGLMKKGIQLMVIFIGTIVIFSYTNIEGFIPVIVVPVWFYSFFTCYSNRKKMFNGIEVEDDNIVEYQWIDDNKKYIGIALIGCGIVGFMNALQFNFLTGILGTMFRDIYWSIKGSIAPVILILVGILLLAKSRAVEDKGYKG